MATSGIGKSKKGGEADPIGNAILIAGPTASGKSALAVELAQRLGGVVVNADSMQVYSGLDLLTARPDTEQRRAAPHRLYGHVSPNLAHSTGEWLRDVARLRDEGAFDRHRPIFVGGTGLYFKALTSGLSAMPEIPGEVRATWRRRLEEEGAAGLHRALADLDAGAAKAIRPSDGQRIVRALEVVEASGRSILDWQSERGWGILEPASARRLVIEPPRAILVERIESRFDRMVAQGALEEAVAMMGMKLDPSLPATKAIGLRELQAHLRGEIALDEAVARAKAATRQYAKRQSTWFRTQFDLAWQRLGTDAQVREAVASLSRADTERLRDHASYFSR